MAEIIDMQVGMDKEFFGELWKYVKDPNIIDVDYNGRQLWIRNSSGEKWVDEDIHITDDFVEAFASKVAGHENVGFNKNQPEMEADTNVLRITFLLDEVATTGTCFFIRKSMPKIRLTEEKMIKEGYCSKEIHDLMVNCIRANLSIIVCGQPGIGKTELEKYLSQSISDDQRAVVVEDTSEWHYEQINPRKDCVTIKIREGVFGYTDAIRASLRMNTNWLIIAEVRGTETVALIEAASTGLNTITSLHTGDVRDIPDRMLSMMGSSHASDRLENDIYRNIDVGILLRWKECDDGMVRRVIDQLCFFVREKKDNSCVLLVKDGEILPDVKLPGYVSKKFEDAGIENPFAL